MSTATYLGTFTPGSPEWLAARKDGIGGSEIAAVMGLSPFESRFSLWHRKAGLVDPVTETEVMEWGKRLEPPIVAKFAECHPELGVQQAGTWRNLERPWQVVSPDRFLIPRSGDKTTPLEIKTARYDDEWGDEGTDEIPVYYRAQALWYLDGLGMDRCHFAVLFTGSDYREYVLDYQPDEAAAMREAAREFLATIAADQRPEIDAHEATYQVVRELHPDIEAVDYEAPESIAVPYLDALAAYDDARAEKRRAGAVLCDAMGTARRALFNKTPIATRVAKGDDATPYLRAVNGASDIARSAA